jgi:hypothetical protein
MSTLSQIADAILRLLTETESINWEVVNALRNQQEMLERREELAARERLEELAARERLEELAARERREERITSLLLLESPNDQQQAMIQHLLNQQNSPNG